MGSNDDDEEENDRLAEARSQLAHCDDLISETRRQRDRLDRLGRDAGHLEERLSMLRRIRVERERYLRSVASRSSETDGRSERCSRNGPGGSASSSDGGRS